jgi:hypothetical protein
MKEEFQGSNQKVQEVSYKVPAGAEQSRGHIAGLLFA